MQIPWRTAFLHWINRRYQNETPPVLLTQRRIYILPTKAGTLFASTIIVMLLGAINYNLSLGFVLVFLLSGMGIAGMLHTYRGLAGLELRPGRCEPVFAGEPATLVVLVRNRGRVPRYSIDLSHYAGAQARTDLDAMTETAVSVVAPPQARGLVRFSRWKISTLYPLGVFCAWSYAHLGHELLVYPKPEQAAPSPPLHGTPAGDGMQGERGLDDFSGLRRYHQGDSLRQVAWKALARGHPLLSKQFTGGAQPELQLRWQDTAELPDPEWRLSRLCRWVLEAGREDAVYSLELPSGRIEMGRGPEHEARCLRALALHDASRLS